MNLYFLYPMKFSYQLLLILIWNLILISCVRNEPKSNSLLQENSLNILKEDLESVEQEKKLVEFSENDSIYQVALLIMNGTYNTELTAPMDIFHHSKFRKGIKTMNVFTIAESLETIETFEGLKINPDFSFNENHPTPDILIIPAAEHHLDSDLENSNLINFIWVSGLTCEYVCSHCDGAFLLAKTGLLKDKVSTTFPGDIDEYKAMFPELEVVSDVDWVHDGKFITSAGGAKSFEASLYLSELIYGKKVAQELAQGMVIDWNLDRQNYLKLN